MVPIIEHVDDVSRFHPFLLELEAHHPGRDHHRAYAVEVERDLLGDWVVRVCFGRAARPGRVRALCYAVADREAARLLVRERLRRRLGAPKRIGCAYRITRALLASGEELAAWVPDALLTAARKNPADGEAGGMLG